MKQKRFQKVSQPEIREEILHEEKPALIGESELVEHQAPHDWKKGALLNVRNAGETYNVTLYPEEFDPRHPERTLKFTNSARCQDFVSNWYMRESHDPRAIR